MSLLAAIQYLHPDAMLDRDFTLRDDGDGAYIATWRLPDVPQPTQAQLDAIAAVAEQRATLQAAMNERESVEPMTPRMQREAFLYNIAAHGRALLDWFDPAYALPLPLPVDPAGDTPEQAKWRLLNLGEIKAIEQERWMREQRDALDALGE